MENLVQAIWDMLIDAFVYSNLTLALLIVGFVLLILITTLLNSLLVKKTSTVELY